MNLDAGGHQFCLLFHEISSPFFRVLHFPSQEKAELSWKFSVCVTVWPAFHSYDYFYTSLIHTHRVVFTWRQFKCRWYEVGQRETVAKKLPGLSHWALLANTQKQCLCQYSVKSQMLYRWLHSALHLHVSVKVTKPEQLKPAGERKREACCCSTLDSLISLKHSFNGRK